MATTIAELTEALVGIASHDDETAAGDRIEAWLADETEAAVRRDGIGNVIARRGDDEGVSVALVGHHDVVPPEGSQLAEDGSYRVERREGRIHGRGAADMKGALAAQLVAFREAELPPGIELVFASFVGEETGGVGARYAIDDGFLPDYAVVGEGSTNYSGPDVTDVVVAHRGRRGSTVTARGTAAHASEPEAGENAIYRATAAIDAIRDLEVSPVSVAGGRLSGSVVVTEIEGGSAMNVVPERCTLTVDERTVPGERADLDGLERLPGIKWAVEQDLPPMECTDETFAERVLAAAAEAQSAPPELATKPHATDAGWLSRAGTECVICGPSEPGEAHTKDESVSIAVLERCYRIYRGTVESWPAHG
ncbi:M20 family metallopeptidase [Saliphagus sp. LR7]|uniref:M20 family metallopeptidase n=1 Tax=Saliphagus sp. LR7 TaxID=2282654 RepID=UPI000DF75BFF|nr:M20/M25/M40 family metallo-hydrolase [Saliphagus sp. LR7]